MQPIPVLLPGESHGQMSLVGYSLWGLESDTTEGLNHHQMDKGDGCLLLLITSSFQPIPDLMLIR